MGCFIGWVYGVVLTTLFCFDKEKKLHGFVLREIAVPFIWMFAACESGNCVWGRLYVCFMGCFMGIIMGGELSIVFINIGSIGVFIVS